MKLNQIPFKERTRQEKYRFNQYDRDVENNIKKENRKSTKSKFKLIKENEENEL